MYYFVKISNHSIEMLRKMIGADEALVNLKTGVIRVSELKDVQSVAARYEVDNVNNSPLQDVLCAEAPEQDQDTRNTLIGKDIVVGSVVRIKRDDGVDHAVILKIDEDKYTAAIMVLKKMDSGIILRKGRDIVYRNMTYKDEVTLTSEIRHDLSMDNFMMASGGLIVGRVTDLRMIKSLIREANGEAGEEESTNAENEQNGSTNNGNERSTASSRVDLDRIFYNMRIESVILKRAAEICLESGRCNIKKLLPVMQERYPEEYGKLSQNAIRVKMTEEFNEWCETRHVKIEVQSVNYFLKEILKKLKEQR